ncbi:MAG: HAD-IC family P-type ATPase, partial [Pseudomonadota bacterium]
IENRQEVAGEGLSGTLPDGRDIRLGSRQWVGLTDSDQNAAGTWVRIGEDPPIQLHFEERLRDGTQETIAALHDMGLSMEILSGDTASRTARMGAMLGLEASGAVKPRDKRAAVDSQSSQATGRTLMIGDGINDAPALAAADASIALASASDISRATADFIILDDRIAGVADSVRLARLSQKRIKENLSLAIIYNFCAIPLAVAGLVNPLIAAVAMSGSSLLVTLNALRMARA